MIGEGVSKQIWSKGCGGSRKVWSDGRGGGGLQKIWSGGVGGCKMLGVGNIISSNLMEECLNSAELTVIFRQNPRFHKI